jgi:hypothetical protein
MTPKNQKRARRNAAIAILLAIVVVLGLLWAYEYALDESVYEQNSSLSSANFKLSSSLKSQSSVISSLESAVFENSNLTVVTQAFRSHVSHISELNATLVADDYSAAAVMKWGGNTFGMAGIYNTSALIQFTWQTFLTVENVTSTIDYVNATRFANGTITVTADLAFNGYSKTAGQYNINTSGTYSYVFQNGEWLISKELTDFTEFNVQYPSTIF